MRYFNSQFRPIVFFTALAATGLFTAQAATLTPVSGDISYNVLIPAVIPSVNGTAVLSFNDPAPIGLLVAVESGPFPNSVLLLTDEGLSEFVSLTFDFASAASIDSSVFIPAAGTSLTTLTNPLLVALLAPSVFRFDFSDAVPIGDAVLFQFLFAGAEIRLGEPVPEPASWMLAGVGLLAALTKLVSTRRKNDGPRKSQVSW
jgi:hypothetical protein